MKQIPPYRLALRRPYQRVLPAAVVGSAAGAALLVSPVPDPLPLLVVTLEGASAATIWYGTATAFVLIALVAIAWCVFLSRIPQFFLEASVKGLSFPHLERGRVHRVELTWDAVQRLVSIGGGAKTKAKCLRITAHDHDHDIQSDMLPDGFTWHDVTRELERQRRAGARTVHSDPETPPPTHVRTVSSELADDRH